MKKFAEVVSVSGNIADVKVERSSMCDGCSAKGSGQCSCSHAALLGADRSMTAKALCNIPVTPGDTVEIETRDSKVLWYAALVFIIPIIVCAALYAVMLRITESESTSLAISAAGFFLTFILIGLFERRNRKNLPDIIVTRVISHNDVNKI